MLAGKRMLIVADNAASEQQVRPLLPGSSACLVVVTSRRQLGGLAAAEGARLISLDLLTHAEAVQLLTTRIGSQRAGAEPDAVDQIARLCACLPLALAVAAARAAARPGLPLAFLAGELADSPGRLDALDAGDPPASVRAVFSWSYDQLSDEAARIFRLLGLHPGPDISVAAAASLAALGPAGTSRLLGELTRAHLLTEHVPGRFALHDLLRSYAADQARHTDSQDDRDAAAGRVLDHYLHTAARAKLLLSPSAEPVALAPPRPGVTAEQPAGFAQAMAWFEAEQQVLLAGLTFCAHSGSDAHSWQLPHAMGIFLQIRGDYHGLLAVARTGLAAATRSGQTAAQAFLSRTQGLAFLHLGDHAQARRHLASSLALDQELGNRRGEAATQQVLTILADRQGRYADALGHAEQALHLFTTTGDKVLEAEAMNNVAWCHAMLGDYEQARLLCRRALALFAGIGSRWAVGSTWDTLGYAERHLGNHAEAAACYQQALTLHRETGNRVGEASTLTHAGDTHFTAGDLAAARDAWRDALAILEDLQLPDDAGQVRARLAGTSNETSITYVGRRRPTPR